MVRGRKWPPLEDRLTAGVAPCPITGCWFWMGTSQPRGYGIIHAHGKTKLVHRVLWEMSNGPVPEGLVLDHFVCNNTSCVNPDHVRPVTQRENVLRGNGVASTHASKSCCPKCGDNYVARKSGDGRYCPSCNIVSCRTRYKRLKDARIENKAANP